MSGTETEKEANIAEIRNFASLLNLDDKGVACLMAISEYGIINLPTDFIRVLNKNIQYVREAAGRHKPRDVEL
jgi:hypothetical protein